jgi:hypothetical protein
MTHSIPFLSIALAITACVPLSPQARPASDANATAVGIASAPSTVASSEAPGAMPPSSSSVRGDVWVGIGFQSGGLYSHGSHRVDYLVMLEDGTAVKKLPAHGLDALDVPALRGYLGDMVGTYQSTDDGVAFQFGTYQMALSRGQSGELTGQSGTYFKADPLDGAVLDGTYAGANDTSNANFVQFTSDGRFQVVGYFDLMLHDNNGQRVVPTAGTGSYRIARNTLTLVYDGGATFRIAIVSTVPGEFPRPSRIMLNTWEYQRR